MLLHMGCLTLAGCLTTYAPVPNEFTGDFVLNGKGALLDSCSLGPGYWSGSTPATCIYCGYSCGASSDCVLLPTGMHVQILRRIIHHGDSKVDDLLIRVGSGKGCKEVHAYGNWTEVTQCLQRQ